MVGIQLAATYKSFIVSRVEPQGQAEEQCRVRELNEYFRSVLTSYQTSFPKGANKMNAVFKENDGTGEEMFCLKAIHLNRC